jgi:hypothetical protein
MPKAVDSAEMHLPVVRAMARERRPAQSGPEWDDLRRYVRTLVANLIHEHAEDRRIVDTRPGLSPARLAPLDEATAVLSVDLCVYLVEGDPAWTSLRTEGEWSRPRAVAITLLYSEVPPEALH